MNNVAGNLDYLEIQRTMRERLIAHLRSTRDPRIVGGNIHWDYYPYYGARRNKDWKVNPSAMESTDEPPGSADSHGVDVRDSVRQY